MKNMVFLFIGLLLLDLSDGVFGSNKETATGNSPVSRHSISIYSSPELITITKTWSDEYCKIHPGVSIEVSQTTNSPNKTELNIGDHLFFVSGKDLPESYNDASWKMVVGHEVVVPIISSRNPFLDNMNKQGISSYELARMLSHPDDRTWGMLRDDSHAAPVHYYVFNDGIIRDQVAQFLKTDPNGLNGISMGNSKEMISAIQKDPYGIGFCRMTDLLDPKDNAMIENIRLLPIDKNNNGQLDYHEKIYDNLNEFARGVWIGKYPRDLCRSIYSISTVKPSNEDELAFLAWVITAGQIFLDPVGYQDIASSNRQTEKLEMLKTIPVRAGMLADGAFLTNKLNPVSLFSLIILVLIPFILAFMIGDAVIRNKRQKTAAIMKTIAASQAVFDENSVELPKGLYFDKTHMWAFMEQNGLVRIGVDDFLQHVTGILTGIKMKSAGDKIKMGEPVLSIIQSGKQLKIHAPISGTIKAQNTALSSNASALNSSPYVDGWVYIIEPANWINEMRFLTMAGQYKEWLKKEFVRLKDFIAASVKATSVEHIPIILQDGGVLRDGILENLGPTIWEEFQINFIDRS